MNTIEERLPAMLTEAAARIDVHRDLDAVVADISNITTVRSPHRPRIALAMASGLLVVSLVGGLALVAGRDSGGEPASSRPVAIPGAPIVVQPPKFVGEMTAGRRQGGYRVGRWTSGALALTDRDEHDAPIAIAAFDQELRNDRVATSMEIEGVPYRLVEVGEWRSLSTTTLPGLMVSGNVSVAVLGSLVGASRIVDDNGHLSYKLGELPDGYEVIAGPVEQGDDPADRPTMVSADGKTVINEVSDWVDPLLYGASTGADVAPIDVNTAEGWTGVVDAARPRVRFVVWSPTEGVVFEAVTTDAGLTEADLAMLAAGVRSIPFEEWKRRNPSFDALSARPD